MVDFVESCRLCGGSCRFVSFMFVVCVEIRGLTVVFMVPISLLWFRFLGVVVNASRFLSAGSIFDGF